MNRLFAVPIKYILGDPLTEEEEMLLRHWRLSDAQLWFKIEYIRAKVERMDDSSYLEGYRRCYEEMEPTRERARAVIEDLVRRVSELGAGGEDRAVTGDSGKGRVRLASGWRLFRGVGLGLGLAMFLAVIFWVMRFSGPVSVPRTVDGASYTVAFQQGDRLVDLGGLKVGGSIYFGRISIRKMAKDSVEMSIVDRGDAHDMAMELPALMIATHWGHTLRAVMPDSTVLWLNAGSELVLASAKPEAWGRSMNLEGEGYFEVRKRGSAANAFTVLTPAVHIVCLGTDFNVRSYASDDKTLVSLVNGKLRLENDSSIMLLGASQQVQADWNGMSRLEIRVSTPPRWKDGVFDLSNATIDEVFGELGRWYNVRFFRRTSIRFGGAINLNESRLDPIDTVLGNLARMNGLHFELHNDSVYVSQ